MSDKIRALALFETTLADKITKTADTMTLVTGVDKKGTALSGIYGLILDEGNSNEEFIIATIAATAVTGASRGIDVADGITEVTALKYTHARGGNVKITNFPLLGIIMGYINDSNDLPAALRYADDVAISDARDLVYKSYADAIATTGITAFAVSDAGGITIDVNSGTYVVNGYVGTYAGVSGQALTDDETNYIQFKDRALDINITGFDNDAIPLATVICASADISSVTDNRPFITYTDIKASSGLARDINGIYIDLDPASILEFNSGKLSFPAVSSHTDNTAGYLTGGTNAQSAFASWAAITDGSFRFKVDGGALQNIDAIDFSGDASMDDVAATIQAAIRTATSSTETCVWDTDHFIITSADESEDSEISVLTTSTGTVGTDISGITLMDCDSTNGVATQGTSDHNKVVKLNSAGKLDDGLISEEIKDKNIRTLVAGEDLTGGTLPQPCLIDDGSLDSAEVISQTTQNVADNLVSIARRRGQQFTTDSSTTAITQVSLYLDKTGAPGNLIVDIYALDGSHKPTGSSLGTATLLATAVTAAAWYDIEFESPVCVSASTQYGLIASSAGSGGAYIQIYRTNAGSVYSGGSYLLSNDSGTNWTITTSEDLAFKINGYEVASTGQVYSSDANDSDKEKFNGFAITTATTGNNITFQSSGIVSGFTGLHISKKYYIQDDKTIGVEVGSTTILAGVAISATELQIEKDNTYL